MSGGLEGAVLRSGKDPVSIAEALVRLRARRLVAIPTETVYGLAARTLDADAVAAIYRAKGRPSDNPLIAHVSTVAMARELVTDWPDEADRLALSLWPGPLTLVLPRAESVPDVATGGRDSIAIRIPAHTVALEVIHRLGEPISAPSANRSGALSPTEARHVMAEFVDLDVLVLDGGPCRVGLESTVVDLRGPRPVVLRPGIVTADRLSTILDCEVDSEVVDRQVDAPGTAESHYAPCTPTRLCEAEDAGGEDVAVISFGEDVEVPARFRVCLPRDAEAVGSLLYATLHSADLSGARRIDVVRPPESSDWAAIRDRLRRATAPRGEDDEANAPGG